VRLGWWQSAGPRPAPAPYRRGRSPARFPTEDPSQDAPARLRWRPAADVPCCPRRGRSGTVGRCGAFRGGEERQLTTGDHELRRWDDVPHLVRVGSHYKRAPIAEAIIEIRCELPDETDLSDLEGIGDESEFPTVDKTLTVTGIVDVGPEGVQSTTTGQQTGHVFKSSDGRHILQARLDGFSFACLAPYERWEPFSAEAERHWYRYRAAARPLRARRLGVRYVNKIDVQGEHIEIKDYLRTAVDVSPYLPQSISSYFFQVVVPLSRFRAFATITSAIVEAEAERSIGLILDIDTWQEVDIDFGAETSSQEIERRLETLRAAKNYVFEACITDATRRLIE
jgi:uncharacterized protein (TIGR04255 family)